jgi:hypothetical protein
VTANRLGKLQQVILLCALAVGVIAMHHVSPSHGMSDAMSSSTARVSPGFEPEMVDCAPGSGEPDPCTPTGLHDMLHLCLAVLCAAGLLLLVLVAYLGTSWLNTTFPRSFGIRGSPRRGRPPDRGGRDILTSLCVLRT